jgi:hypothetical protein
MLKYQKKNHLTDDHTFAKLNIINFLCLILPTLTFALSLNLTCSVSDFKNESFDGHLDVIPMSLILGNCYSYHQILLLFRTSFFWGGAKFKSRDQIMLTSINKIPADEV